MEITDKFGTACSSPSTILKNKSSILGALRNGASAKNLQVRLQREAVSVSAAEPPLDLFTAMEMVPTAWVPTCPAVIANCFKHASFISTQQA